MLRADMDVEYQQEEFLKDLQNYETKRQANTWGMWAIVDLVWTKQLADWIAGRKVLEVMAGRGWLAKALKHYNVNIVATDNKPWETSPIFEVEKLDAVAAAKHAADFEIMIMSWPPYDDAIAIETCRAWGSSRPIVYIGEGPGGCNANDEFFDHFAEIKNQPEISLPRWYGLRDYLSVGHYVPERKGDKEWEC